ncbi:hypothetical protein [Bradyrhizobium sp. 5.13L]
MTLARFCLISSIPMLLVVGNPEAANITMALATDAPMQTKEIGTALTKSRHETIVCCGASEEPFRHRSSRITITSQVRSTPAYAAYHRRQLLAALVNRLTRMAGRAEAPGIS